MKSQKPISKSTPKLTEEAKEEIKSFYVEIRNRHKEHEGMKPILISQEDLVKIKKSAEDFAKSRKSNVVEKEDARMVTKEWVKKNLRK